MNEIMLKIDNVSKMYKLGQIGGTTLRDELQRKRAKIRGQEDPTKIIGTKDYNQGETFMALDGISFEVKKGERVGIIGHNGAGKSTLLKLISRVTAPTGGTIGLNGRVASMLEVGTGFHGELTGRENIYMNGAILGMTKKEIDAKIEDIIDFSEVRQFIDTPVKRYSSGMYVKLAFSVAAHLDSEIMIMDEVLAVGDMNFQHKCLKKMRNVSEQQGRTVLYVSHNMETIRKLCQRCICLEHGKNVYDGAVESAISFYSNMKDSEYIREKQLVGMNRHGIITENIQFLSFSIESGENYINCGTDLIGNIEWKCKKAIEKFKIRVHIYTVDGRGIGYCETDDISCKENEIYKKTIILPSHQLMPGKYTLTFLAITVDDIGNEIRHDCVDNVWIFKVIQDPKDCTFNKWNNDWGYIRFDKIREK